jgi:hypothetical protein
LAYLNIQKNREYLFLYGRLSKRTPKGPRNTKKCLGKIDKITNNLIINNNYRSWLTENSFSEDKVIQFLKAKGFNMIDYNIKISKVSIKRYSEDDIRNSTVISIGISHLMRFICSSCGLTEIITTNFVIKARKYLH